MSRTTHWKSVVEWLHEHPSRHIVIRPAGHHDEEGLFHPRENAAAFVLTTRLPDGRKVSSKVEVRDELLEEPESGTKIVYEAITAIAGFLKSKR